MYTDIESNIQTIYVLPKLIKYRMQIFDNDLKSLKPLNTNLLWVSEKLQVIDLMNLLLSVVRFVTTDASKN